MSIVVLKLPDVMRQTETRPRECPYCQGETFQRWGSVTKAVRDPQLQSVKVYRYRCCHCYRTFRHYPPGVDQADQTQRMRKLAALCWALGLNYRSIAGILAAFGIRLSQHWNHCRVFDWHKEVPWTDNITEVAQCEATKPVQVCSTDRWSPLRLPADSYGNAY